MDKHKFLSKTSARRTALLLCAMLIVAFGKGPYEYLKDFCSIGERVPGTTGHKKALAYIVHNLSDPQIDSFNLYDTWFYNVYQRFPGENGKVGLAVHWDSDVNCPGANDGGSGVALLLSLADTLRRSQPKIGVDLLFFDGEDFGKAELIGSKHFAAVCLENYSYIIVLDMVGDKDLKIFKEGNSDKFYPQLVDSIWQIARESAPNVFVPQVKYFIVDDHISLIKYGMRAIDIIDFDYQYWHTKEDTIDKCSEKSLGVMYRFLLKLVYPEYRD